jgi:hypothetical protein
MPRPRPEKPVKFRNSRTFLTLTALALAASVGACRRAMVIVPQPANGYSARDTLYGYHKGNRVQVTFRFDTLWRVDTVTRTDTLWRAGTRTIVRVDTVRVETPVPTPVPTPTRVPTTTPRPTGTPAPARIDTVYFPLRDTIRVTVRDTVRVVVRDTIRLAGRDTVRIQVRDTVRVTLRDTIRVTVRDTVTITLRDTLRITLRDTIRVAVRDTIRIPGRRELFVPPGQYPPEGQCRVWVHDLPPGRQANPAPCNALGTIPTGAFILFRGNAWDFDYDWVSESTRSSVPPEIVALSRRGRP